MQSNYSLTSSVGSKKIAKQHDWVSVMSPVNFREVVQACDCCGVVKSSNSIYKSCQGNRGAAIISSAMLQYDLAG